MPLFQCEECGVVENTALSNYHVSKARRLKSLCSLCDPRIKKWHGAFERKNAFKEGYYTDGRYVYHPDTICKDTLRWNYNNLFKMIGVVPEIPIEQTSLCQQP